MSTKTGSNFGTIVALVLAVAAVAIIAPAVKEALKDDDALVVTVDFLPATRSGEEPPGRSFPDVVTVEIDEGRLMHPKENLTKSPKNYVLHPKTSMEVTVRVSQVYGANAGCTIQRRSDVVAVKRISGAGTAVCRYKFKI